MPTIAAVPVLLRNDGWEVAATKPSRRGTAETLRPVAVSDAAEAVGDNVVKEDDMEASDDAP